MVKMIVISTSRDVKYLSAISFHILHKMRLLCENILVFIVFKNMENTTSVTEITEFRMLKNKGTPYKI